MKLNPAVTDYIKQATEEQVEILETLRQLIHESVTETTEEIKWSMPVFRKNKAFTYLRFSAKHITLGFYNFDRIDDDQNILEGTGNTMRHVKIKNMNDIKKTLFTNWLKTTAD